jgi:protein phosphatase
VDPQVGAVAYEKGDIFVLCTDGVTDGLFDGSIADCIRARDDALNPAPRLVQAAVEASGRDNTTAVVIEAL